jgi:hypothetical protein
VTYYQALKRQVGSLRLFLPGDSGLFDDGDRGLVRRLAKVQSLSTLDILGMGLEKKVISSLGVLFLEHVAPFTKLVGMSNVMPKKFD